MAPSTGSIRLGGGLMVFSASVFPDLIGRKEPTPALITKVVSRFSAMAALQSE